MEAQRNRAEAEAGGKEGVGLSEGEEEHSGKENSWRGPAGRSGAQSPVWLLG